MKAVRLMGLAVLALVLAGLAVASAEEEKMFGDAAIQALQEALKNASPQTQSCVSCHIQYTPTIVYEWAMSEHAKNKPAAAAELYDKIGATEWKDKIADWAKNYDYVVGCYECHGKFADQERPDVVNHFGYNIVTVVTRKDCAQCHPKESAEISWTWHAMGSLHAPVLPWYKAILAKAKKMGANPFGDENAKKLYEKYFPPYLTKQRDKDDIYWDFYKYFVKDLMKYLETGEEGEYLKFVKEATGGYLTPYDLDWKKWVSPLWPASGVLNTTVVERLVLPKISKPLSGKIGYAGIVVNAMGQFNATVTNVMNHPAYRNGYVYHACLECHGSLVIPYGAENANLRGMSVPRMKLWGWPNNGAARVDPDGSIGTCTACHDRHLFSLKQARTAWTCGRCHLGYDHPHIEIYEESAHGNIETAYGEQWNWEALPWRAGVDFNAPTCATCHMSTIARVDANGNTQIVVEGTHDLVARLVWNQMHFFGTPKPVIPDKVQEGLFLHYSVLKGKMEDVYKAHEMLVKEGVPEQYQYPVFMGFKLVDETKFGETKFPRMIKFEYSGELAKHREEMKKVCTVCHSSQWADNFFRTADQNIIDYDIVARYAFNLLQLAWSEGIADKSNILDEFPEIMWYYIWHHQGRRWRNGAFMMGPDFAHWYGIVDTVMEALGKMTNWIAIQLEIKATKQELEALKAAAAGGQMSPALVAKIQELEQKLRQLQMQLAQLEASAQALAQQVQSMETGYYQVEETVNNLQTNVDQLAQQLQQLAEQLKAAGVPEEKVKEIEAAVQKIQQAVSQLETAAKQASEAAKAAQEKAGKAEEKAATAEEKVSGIEGMLKELIKKVEDLDKKLGALSRNTYLVAGLALALAVIALGLTVARKQ